MSISPPVPRWYRPRVDLQGRFLGVLYHTHNGGTHLALGSTEKALAATWRTIVENLGRREVDRTSCFRLDFVDPAPDLLRALDEKRLAECLDTYKQALARAACSAGPPSGMRFCLESEYLGETGIRGGGYDFKYPPPITEEHAWCRRCAYGLLWEGDTSPERQQSAWESVLWNEEVVRLMGEHTNRLEAQGARLKPESFAMRERPERAPANPTHLLHGDFGHHSAGIVMTPVGEVDFGENFHTRQVLAFVRAETVELPFVDETIRTWQVLLEAEERRRKETWQRECSARDAERAEQDLQILLAFSRAVGLEE